MFYEYFHGDTGAGILMKIKTYTRLYCRQALNKLDDYLDRELSEEDIQDICRHLAICKLCAEKFKFEAEVVQQLKSKTRRISTPPELLGSILREIGHQSSMPDQYHD